mgnify:CR=1 FL=1
MRNFILILTLAMSLVSCANPEATDAKVIPTSAVLSPSYTHHYVV